MAPNLILILLWTSPLAIVPQILDFNFLMVASLDEATTFKSRPLKFVLPSYIGRMEATTRKETMANRNGQLVTVSHGVRESPTPILLRWVSRKPNVRNSRRNKPKAHHIKKKSPMTALIINQSIVLPVVKTK